MSDSIGFRSNELQRQWGVQRSDNADERNAKVAIRQNAIRDQLTASQDSVAQLTYAQNINAPRLADPQTATAAQQTQQPQLANSVVAEKQTELQQTTAAYLATTVNPSAASGVRMSASLMKMANSSINEDQVQQLAKQYGVSPEKIRSSVLFAKAHPEIPLDPPMNEIVAQIKPQKLGEGDDQVFTELAFNELVESDPKTQDQVNQIAQKLKKTPDEVKQMVRDARTNGSSPDPDVQKLAQSLGPQAEQQAVQEQTDFSFQRALGENEESVNQLAQKLGTTPENVKQQLTAAYKNPGAPADPEIQQAAEQLTQQAKQSMQSPVLDAKGAFDKTLEANSELVNQLAQKLGVSPDEAKQMLAKAFANPNADVPYLARQLATVLGDKAMSALLDGATGQLALKKGNKNLKLSEAEVQKLAKMLKMKPGEIRNLLLQGMGQTSANGMNPELFKLAQSIKTNSEAEAFSEVNDQALDGDVDKGLSAEYDKNFELLLEKTVTPGSASKLRFIKQNPDLKNQMDPDLVKLAEQYEGAASNILSDQMGTPTGYTPPALARTGTEEGSRLYDNTFEEQLQDQLAKGLISPDQAKVLRGMHYMPNKNFPDAAALQQKFQEIESTVKDQVKQALGAPPGWEPTPGSGYESHINAQLSKVLEKGIKELQASGEISGDQAKQIEDALSGKNVASADIQDIIDQLMASAKAKVAKKFSLPTDFEPVIVPLSTGSLDPKAAKLAKNGLDMASEMTEGMSKRSKEMGGPIENIYKQYILITRTALDKLRQWLFEMNSKDADIAKNDAITAYDKNMMKSLQLKKAYKERAEAIEKARALGPLMIFLMVIMAVIMAILTVLTGGAMGMLLISIIIAVVMLLVEMINIILFATDSSAAEAFNIFAQVLQAILILPLLLMAPMKAAMQAIKMGIMAALKAAAVAALSAVKAAVGNLIKELITMVKTAVKALLEGLQNILNVIKMIGKVLAKLGKGLLAMAKSLGGSASSGAQNVTQGASDAVMEGMRQMLAMMMKIMDTFIKPALSALRTLGQDTFEAFRELGKNIVKGLVKLARMAKEMITSPIETVKNAGKSIYSSIAKTVKSIRSMNMTKLKGWENQMSSPDGISLNVAKLQSGLQGAAAATQGVQTITQSRQQLLMAESVLIMAKLDAWLNMQNEMIAAIRKMIEKILAGLNQTGEWISKISEDNNQFFAKLNQSMDGLFHALEG